MQNKKEKDLTSSLFNGLIKYVQNKKFKREVIKMNKDKLKLADELIKKNRADFIKTALEGGVSEHVLWSWFSDKRKLQIINALCARV